MYCRMVIASLLHNTICRDVVNGDPGDLVVLLSTAFSAEYGGGGTPHMKGVGMLVVSFRGVNFGFWSHLRCSG